MIRYIYKIDPSWGHKSISSSKNPSNRVFQVSAESNSPNNVSYQLDLVIIARCLTNKNSASDMHHCFL